jgi:hypothetical protein
MDWQQARAQHTEGTETWAVGRPALVMEFYGTGKELAPHGRTIFEKFLALVPEPERAHLHALTTSSYKPLNAAAIRRAVKELSELDKRGRFYSITSAAECQIGEYSCEWSLGGKQEWTNDDVAIALPIAFATPESASKVISIFSDMLATVPFWGAIASIGYDVVWGREFEQSALPVNWRLAQRHRGMLVHNRGQRGDLIIADDDKVPRKRLYSAGWLTYLGQSLLDQLDGVSALDSAVQAGATLTPLRGGALVQAGPVPPVGDVNRQDKDVEILRQVHRAIEPIVLDVWTVPHYNILGVERDVADSWLHRFDE